MKKYFMYKVIYEMKTMETFLQIVCIRFIRSTILCWQSTGCVIGGKCYRAGAANPQNFCEFCDSVTNTTLWTRKIGRCDGGMKFIFEWLLYWRINVINIEGLDLILKDLVLFHPNNFFFWVKLQWNQKLAFSFKVIIESYTYSDFEIGDPMSHQM
jgi:hypothetical protein